MGNEDGPTGRSRWEGITELDDLINEAEYPAYAQEVTDFLHQLMAEVSIDTVIGADRKGLWIIEDFSRANPGFTKFITSDNQIDPKQIRGLSVLIFDDSIKTGTKFLKIIDDVMKHGPKSVVLACLLANQASIARLQSAHPDIRVKTCKLVFEDYEAQSEAFVRWEVTYLSGLRMKENPDYTSLVLHTPFADTERLIDIVGSTLKSLVTSTDEHRIESIANTRGSTSVSIMVETDERVLPPPYSMLCEPDCAKIRYTVVKNGSSTEIAITPMINPRFDYEGCTIWSSDPDMCFHKLHEIERSDAMCKMCVPVLVNFFFITRNVGAITTKLQEQGILINEWRLVASKLKRFQR